MKSRIVIICVALVSMFFIACPMPQVGVGRTKDEIGGTDQTGPLPAGASISVVNDEARNQAVYINEAGQRFDVVAEEYPGGPLTACVQVADFTLVPPSTDPDALPVKALVTGMRDDGTPGVWEIHGDDSIHIPQPEQTVDNTARCIVGADMTTLPDGVQMRYGWSFQTVAFGSTGNSIGNIIVGTAMNKHGATIGGIQILPNTPIAVYWRVYSLPYSKFCIVSAPRIIGMFQAQTLPAKWGTRGHEFSDLLRQLKLFLEGKLESYLTVPFVNGVRLETPPGVSTAAAQAAGVYIVTGLDEFSLPATARIDKSGNITIAETLPYLALDTLTVSPSPQDITSSWTVNAPLTNTGDFEAKAVTLSYSLTNDANVTQPIGSVYFDKIAPGPAPGSTSITTTLAKVGFNQAPGTTVTYTVHAVVTADKTANYGLDLGTSASDFSFKVTTSGGALVVTLSNASGQPITQLAPLFLNGGSTPWTFGVTVTLGGVPTTAGTLSVFVKNDATPTAAEVPVYNSVPISSQLSGTLAQLDGLPGNHHVRVVATVGSVTAEASCAVPVIYDRIVLDTYDPTKPGSISTDYPTNMELWVPGGTTAMATDNGLASSRPPSALNQYFAYIDYNNNAGPYKNQGGLAPGTYYVLVTAGSDGDTFGYGIRVLTAPNSSYDGWTFTPAITSEPGTDEPMSGPPPSTNNYQAMQVNNPPPNTPPDRLNRFIVLLPDGIHSGVNWMKLILP